MFSIKELDTLIQQQDKKRQEKEKAIIKNNIKIIESLDDFNFINFYLFIKTNKIELDKSTLNNLNKFLKIDFYYLSKYLLDYTSFIHQYFLNNQHQLKDFINTFNYYKVFNKKEYKKIINLIKRALKQ